jgi:predicted ATPase
MLKAIRLRSLPEDASKFPWTLEIIANFQALKFESPITFFVGENGSGKSTILEAIAAASNVPIAGSRRLEDDPSLSAALDLGNRLILTHDEKMHHGLLARSEDFIGFARKIKQDIHDLDLEKEEIIANFTGGDLKLALGPINGEKAALLARYGKDLETLSHGEGFLTLFKSRITGRGLYLIDEPEAALSPSRQLTLISLILKKVK